MATITEDYCSFELSKLLKEKGFDCETDMYYTPEGKLYCWMSNGLKSWLNNKGHETWWWKCVAPTLQMAMKWLREVHDIKIMIRPYVDGTYSYEILNGFWYVNFDSYEDAEEAAIKYCLENLI